MAGCAGLHQRSKDDHASPRVLNEGAVPWYNQRYDETAVSIPDDVFQKGEKAAKRLKMSRSELYAKAIEAYVDAHTPDAITESWNAMLAELAPAEIEEDLRVVRAAARQTMKRNPW